MGPQDPKDVTQGIARDLSDIVTKINMSRADATHWLKDPNYEASRLRLENAHAAAEAALVEARRRVRGEEASYWAMGVYLLTWLAEGKDTDGRYALAEVVIPKGIGEPPPHTHTREDESYYVLEGEFAFRIGGQTVEAGPGDYVWLPRGIEHGFELKTEQAKALITHPGGPRALLQAA